MIAGLLGHRWPIPVGAPPLTWIVGSALFLVAFGVALLSRLELARAGTTISVRQPTTALVTSGPFRYSRNPLYLCLTTAYVGIAIAFNIIVWALALLPALLFIVQTRVIAREELYLERLFGQAYLDYKAKARRWL